MIFNINIIVQSLEHHWLTIILLKATIIAYHIAGNFGEVFIWRIGDFAESPKLRTPLAYNCFVKIKTTIIEA